MVNKCIAYFYNYYVIGLFIAIAFFTCFDIFATYMEYGRLSYTDTDPYTRALRITDWLTDFQWFEKTFPFSNPPDGEVLHFTRICDILWTFFALPFFPFYSVKESIFYGGMIFAPFFFFLSAITICAGTQPYIQNSNQKETYFTICLVIALAVLYKYTGIFSFSRPDHHALMCFIYCFNITALLLTIRNPQKAPILYAGMLSGIGIWTSSAVEGFFMLGSVLSCLCMLWIFYNMPCKIIFKYSVGLCLSVSVAFALNPPYGGYFIFDNLRLSLIHVITCLSICFSFGLTDRLNPQSITKKTLTITTCAFLSFCILLFIFKPSVIFSPIYHPDVQKYFLPYVSEMRSPLIRASIVYIPFYLLCLAILLFCCRQIKSKKHIALLCFLTSWYFIPACINYRFLWYLAPSISYLLLLYLYQILSLSKQSVSKKIQAFVLITGILFLLMSFHQDISPKKYDLPKIEGTILTGTFTGPQLAFEKNIRILTTPYHTNINSIVDNYTLFYNNDEHKLKELIKRHQITYIYIPDRDMKIHYTPEQLPKRNITNQILTGRQDFPWLEKISADEDNYYLYKINYDLL